jgi:hypothetical protein
MELRLARTSQTQSESVPTHTPPRQVWGLTTQYPYRPVLNVTSAFARAGGIEENNIFVTLGKVNWRCHGRWHYLWGIEINETPEPGPLQESSDFPTWEQILILDQ